jgi:hypothetical protein
MRVALQVTPRLLAHAPERIRLWTYLRQGDAVTWLTAPVVYSVIVPFALLDVWIALYQAICFRAWGVRPVRRRDYFAVDRHRLTYLNAVEKLNCLFCSYANGLLAYVSEVAARTEQYWCPIKHARRVRGRHARARRFTRYGDAAAYRRELPVLRSAIKR